MAYNQEHGIIPASIIKEVRDITERVHLEAVSAKSKEAHADSVTRFQPADLPKSELQKLIDNLEAEMKAAARGLEFEKAAVLRSAA
jgi:excinuclease ABC subunit B